MNYYMATVPVLQTGGTIITDNKKIDEFYQKQVRKIQIKLTNMGYKWKHAYFFPGDDYYAYIISKRKLQGLNKDIELTLIKPDRNSWKFHMLMDGRMKELTVEEYMLS